MDHLRSGVQDQPDQHGETPSLKKKKQKSNVLSEKDKTIQYEANLFFTCVFVQM